MLKTLMVIALMTAAPIAADAALIYEQPVNAATGDAGAFSHATQRLAGEFILGTASAVSRATWYGTMFSADPLNTGDIWPFDVIFRVDASGLPGGILASAAVSAAVTDTGIDIAGERLYLFDADFSSVALAGGVSYWFSVENTGPQDTFRWTEATSGLGSALSGDGIFWSDLTEESRTPLNFALYDGAAAVPEPSTLALLGIGLVGLGLVLRGARSRR